MLLIQQDNNGQTFDTKVGQVFEIRLPENPTTGFRWTVTADKSACSVVRDEFHSPQPAPPGASGEHTWEFKAVAPGDCEIALSYRRPWQTEGQPAQAFKVHVRITP